MFNLKYRNINKVITYHLKAKTHTKLVLDKKKYQSALLNTCFICVYVLSCNNRYRI